MPDVQPTHAPRTTTLVSVVVPVFNNAASLPDVLASLQLVASRNPHERFEFVFVDDGSRDGSVRVLQQLLDNDSRIRIVKLSRNFGANVALTAGLEDARGEVVAAVAADMQDPPELIHEMLCKWREGQKIVLAARASRDDPRLTAWLANAFYALFRRFAIPTMPRHGFDFFLVDRQVCDLITGVREHNGYVMGLIVWLGFDFAVIQYHRRRREARYGRSMWTLARKVKYFIDSFVAFSYVPVRAASVLGIVLSVLGLTYAGIVIATRLLFDKQVDGWASLMVVLLLVSGAQLLIMGILGEYLWRNLDEARRRPRFVVETRIERAEPMRQDIDAATLAYCDHAETGG